MAELSYNDVQRAVQDSTRDLRDGLSRIVTQIEHLNNLSREISVLHGELNAARGALQKTVTELSFLRRSVSNEAMSIQRMQTLAKQIQNVDSRLENIEAYLSQLSEYLKRTETETEGTEHPEQSKS